MFLEALLLKSELAPIYRKVQAGERLGFADGLALFRSENIQGIGHMADLVRERHNGNLAYYVVNQHINYSNICKNQCRFCAFSRRAGEDGAYQMTVEEALARARAEGNGKTEFHVVGGLHPELRLDYYLELLSGLKALFPDVHLQALTAVEVAHLAELEGLTVGDTLGRLKEAGLDSLPGGGAEVFSSRVREAVCPEKLSPEGWLSVMREAHAQGLRSNATMLYGHLESLEERVDHMLRLRALQDETGGFMSFIPLAFHPANTGLSELPPTGAIDDLKTLAVGRLMLDNFPHIKAFWIMLGMKLAQVSLSFGVDDIDGTVVEERITHMAGARTPESLTVEEITSLIQEAGREPVERDTLYRRVHRQGERWWIDRG